MRRALLLVSLLLLASLPAHAQVVCPTVAGSTGTYGIDAIALDGDLVYLGSSGFKVIDVSDPNAPLEIGSDVDWAYGLEVDGDLVYAAGYGTGLKVFDVSDPNAPDVVATCPGRGNALRVDVDGDRAYLANDAMDVGQQDGLQVIDISAPLAPVEVGFLEAPIRDMEGVGDFVFAAVQNSGLWVIDVSDPNDPNHVASAETGGQPFGIDVEGDFAYLATRFGGLRVVNIVDPLDPEEVGFFVTEDAIDVVVLGTVAYVADNFGNALRIIDVSDPTAPVEIGHHVTGARLPQVAAGGGYAYFAEDGGPFTVLDVGSVSGCPMPLFADGFETGDTLQWSTVTMW